MLGDFSYPGECGDKSPPRGGAKSSMRSLSRSILRNSRMTRRSVSSFPVKLARAAGLINSWRKIRGARALFDLSAPPRSVFFKRATPGGVVVAEWKSSIPYANTSLSHDASRATENPRCGGRLGNLKSHHLRTCQSVDVIRFE